MPKTPFTPENLPLKIERINQLSFISELIQANKKIAQYQVLLQNTKLPSHLLLNPVMLNEAVQSTKIEGTQVTLDEVLEVEAQSRKKIIRIFRKYSTTIMHSVMEWTNWLFCRSRQDFLKQCT